MPRPSALFGYSAAEAVGRPITLIIPADRQEEEKEILSRIRAGERVDHFETVRVGKDGRPIHVSLTISPVLDESGRVVGASKTARDITDRKRADERIQSLIGELKQADRRKDEFLALLAHELRGPLAPLRNMLEIMKRGGDSGDNAQPAHSVMERQLGQLVRLVDDLLDVSRITHNKIALVKERVELAWIVGQVLEASRPLAESQNQQVSVTLPPRPIHLNADRRGWSRYSATCSITRASTPHEAATIWLIAEEGERGSREGERHRGRYPFRQARQRVRHVHPDRSYR